MGRGSRLSEGEVMEVQHVHRLRGAPTVSALVVTIAVLGEGIRASHTFFLTGFARPVECDGVSSAVSRTKNTIRVSIPTNCLHRPRWVRGGLVFETANRRGTFFDDPLREGLAKPRPVKLTPRLQSGSG